MKTKNKKAKTNLFRYYETMFSSFYAVTSGSFSLPDFVSQCVPDLCISFYLRSLPTAVNHQSATFMGVRSVGSDMEHATLSLFQAVVMPQISCNLNNLCNINSSYSFKAHWLWSSLMYCPERGESWWFGGLMVLNLNILLFTSCFLGHTIFFFLNKGLLN